LVVLVLCRRRLPAWSALSFAPCFVLAVRLRSAVLLVLMRWWLPPPWAPVPPLGFRFSLLAVHLASVSGAAGCRLGFCLPLALVPRCAGSPVVGFRCRSALALFAGLARLSPSLALLPPFSSCRQLALLVRFAAPPSPLRVAFRCSCFRWACRVPLCRLYLVWLALGGPLASLVTFVGVQLNTRT
jgi:hypothetical protein